MSSKAAEQIQERVTIPEVLQRYGCGLGRYNRIPCPVHKGKDANFAYTNTVYHCWTCGAKGDVIGLVMNLFELNFGQALVKLNSDFSLGLTAKKPTYREQLAEKRRREEQKRIKAEKEELRRRYLRACKLHSILFRMLQRQADMEGLDKYVDQLNLWLDEHIEEVRA